MYSFALKTFVLFCSLNSYEFAAVADKHSARIIHGKQVNVKDFPYYAGLLHCGAAILSESWVITAAHCMIEDHGLIRMLSVGGESFFNSRLISYDTVVIHQDFIYTPPMNDIALLHLTEPLNFTDKIQPVQLPSFEDPTRSHPDSKLVFIGRGTDETGRLSRNLQKMEVHRLSAEECLEWMPYEILELARPVLRSLEKAIICAERVDGPAGVCGGDSGSPLVEGNTLVGLASFILSEDCEDTNLSFYVNVANYVPWIRSVTGLK